MSTEEQGRTPSWKAVIILFIVFFPIGIFLMITKVTREKYAYAQNGKTMSALGWVYVALGLIYLLSSVSKGAEANPSVSAALMAFFYFIIGGITLVLVGLKLKLRGAKYYRYMSIVGAQNGGPIADIAAAYPTSYEAAYGDLEQMMRDGYFPGSYINPDSKVFILSAFDEDGNPVPVEVPQARTLTCGSCVGSSTVQPGASAVCSYCSSPLSDEAKST